MPDIHGSNLPLADVKLLQRIADDVAAHPDFYLPAYRRLQRRFGPKMLHKKGRDPHGATYSRAEVCGVLLGSRLAYAGPIPKAAVGVRIPVPWTGPETVSVLIGHVGALAPIGRTLADYPLSQCLMRAKGALFAEGLGQSDKPGNRKLKNATIVLLAALLWSREANTFHPAFSRFGGLDMRWGSSWDAKLDLMGRSIAHDEILDPNCGWAADSTLGRTEHRPYRDFMSLVGRAWDLLPKERVPAPADGADRDSSAVRMTVLSTGVDLGVVPAGQAAGATGTDPSTEASDAVVPKVEGVKHKVVLTAHRKLVCGELDCDLSLVLAELWTYFANRTEAKPVDLMRRNGPISQWHNNYSSKKAGTIRTALTRLSQKLESVGCHIKFSFRDGCIKKIVPTG
jgi:hypothetical protein